MTTSMPYVAMLNRHPQTSSRAVDRIEVRLGWTRSGGIAVAYVLKGAIDGLRIQSPQAPRRVDRLWEHTCFEAFVAVKGKPEYYEFNFAPSGEWAAYGFCGYRDNVPLEIENEKLAPGIAMRCAHDSLGLDAIIHLNRLPKVPPRARLKLALSAVTEEKGGMLSYWALQHPPGRPDFHHADAFSLEIETPDVGAAMQSGIGSR